MYQYPSPEVYESESRAASNMAEYARCAPSRSQLIKALGWDKRIVSSMEEMPMAQDIIREIERLKALDNV